MSFILDALKKSEMERQRQSLPGLMDAGVAAPRPRFPSWAVAIVVLLGINLLILLVMVLRSGRPVGAAAVTVPAATSAATRFAGAAPGGRSSPGAAQDAHFSPLDAPPVYAPEIPVPGDGEERSAPAAATGGMHRAEPVLAQRTAPASRDAAADPDEILPTMSELNLTGDHALPEMHLDVHVYATSTADRFVYVNMRKYREGAVLQEGPKVERIRRDGVVLDYQGLRFLLPRQ